MRYRRGTSRFQQSFLSLDDQLSQKAPVRLFDQLCEDYVKQTSELAFEKGHKDTGRKAYHPSDLLKILVYGYFNGISSSRKLERECGRNLELKWLTGDLVPDHKTIADFRRDQGELVQGLFDYFVILLKDRGLIKGQRVSVDGTKIKAYAGESIEMAMISQKLEDIQKRSAQYLAEMELIDQGEDDLEELSERKAALEEDLEALEAKKKRLESSMDLLEERGVNKISPSDPDAKVMRGRSGRFWGYNVQTAVDTDHHMLVSIQATDHQNDKGLLTPMIRACKQLTSQKPKEVLADAGYYKISELENLDKEGISCYVAINWTPTQVRDQKHGIKFQYDENNDTISCSEGRSLGYWRKKTEQGRTYKVYKGAHCSGCLKKEACTTIENRTVLRYENQLWVDAYHAKMSSPQGKNKLTERKATSEHPFGTLKYNMGQIPILLRGKYKVQTEVSLYGLGYNLRRYLTIWASQEKQQAVGNRKAA